MAVEAWLQKNAYGWDTLTNQEKGALRDFPVLWAYLEAWLSYPYTANPKRINAKVDSMGADIFAAPLPQLNAAYAHFQKRFLLDGSPTNEFRTVNLGRNRQFVLNILLDRNPEVRQKLKAVLYIINRLRNNYLHGS